MSGKRFNPFDDPPTASSSDDDDEVETSIGESEEIEGNSSSETEEEDDVNSRNPSAKKPETALAETQKNQVSDSESGSEEESDHDSETERKDRIAKLVPSVVKPVTETTTSTVMNHDSKKGKSSEKSGTKKRSSSETDGAAASTVAKKVKSLSGEDEKKSGGGGGGEETKKTYFQRVWSEEDEISLLQGIIDYKTDTGLSHFDDKNAFYQLLKKSISFDVSKIQFFEKLRALKKKCENNLGKGKKGEEPTFSKPHDRKAFDLSKLIWGANGIAPDSANGKPQKSGKSKKVEPVKQELVSSSLNGKNCEDEGTNEGEVLGTAELDAFMKSFLVKSLARLGVDDLAAQQGWSRLASEDKKRFEEQGKALQLREFEFYSAKSGFIHELVAKMAESFRPNS